MAEINDNVKKLYNSLKLEGYTDLGDIDQFDGKLKDSGARKSLYDALNRDGFTDLGEFGEFETKLGYEMPKDLVSPANDVTSSPLTSPVNAQPVTEQDNQGTQPEQEKGFWGTFAGDVIQRINAGGQDLGAGIFGLLDKGARGLENLTGGLVKSGGAFGQIADTFERDAAISRARSNRYQGKDYKQLWDEGDYAGIIGDIVLTGAESLPMSIAAAASSVVNPAAGLVGIGAITASEKYDQLDESNPNMKEFPKLANAILTGFAEGASEMLGAGVSNAWIKGLYKTMGKEKAEQAIQQGLLGKLREHFKRFGIFYEPVEEGLEEVSSQFAQNVTDKITGASPDIDVTEGLADSFVYGMGGGAYFSAANLPAYARQRVLERRANRQAETKRQDDSFRTATNNAYEAAYKDTSREGINSVYNNAQSKKANLDAIDPGLAVTIDQYVNDNASEGEVMSLMEGLDGDTRAAAEEYYNSQIAMRGVEDRALDNVDKTIEEITANVMPYVTTTEDGRREYTTAQYDEGLYHGQVFVKSIEGDKAIIYQDGKEKMVDAKRLSNKDTKDLDVEINKIKSNMTANEQSRLDLFTQHHPKTSYPEPGLVVFNGKDAFILQGQDENGDWSAFPAVFDKEIGQVTAKANGTPSILTEREILELQDNAYASQDMPVNEQVQQEQQPEQTIKTSEIEGENATSPSSGESNVSQETPQSDLDRVIASLPKKDGSIDYKAMTPMQQYDYTSVSEGPETALADLQQDVEAKRVELSGIEDKIAKATGGDRAALRDQARAKRKEYEELTAFYNSVAPAPASVETIQEEQEPSPIVETQEEPVAESVSEETTTTETAQEEPVFRTVHDEIEDLFDGSLDNDEIDQLVDANIKEAEKALGKIKKPAVGADKAAYLEKKKEYEAKREAAQAVVDHWNDVKAQIANNRAGVEQQAIPDLEEIGEPLNAHELAAEMLANGSIKLTRDSYMQETGFGDQETKGMFGLFASPEKGGVSVERAGEILTQADSEGGYNFIDPNEPNAARDVIIDVLSQAKTRGDLINYIKRRREEMANRERQAAYNDYAKWTQDNFGMTPEEWEAYNDAVDRDIRSIGITDEELSAIDGEIYDDMLAEQQDYAEIYGQLNQQQDETNQGNEQGRDQEPGEGGGEVLPTEQPVETGRDGVVEGEREAGDDVNRQDDGAQAIQQEVKGQDLFDFAEQVVEENKRKKSGKVNEAPLTTEEIDNSDFDQVVKDGAKSYLDGNVNFATSIAYQQIYNNVRNRSGYNEPDRQGTDGTQLDGEVDGAGSSAIGRGRDENDQVGNEGGQTPVSGQGERGQDSVLEPVVPNGEQGDNVVPGEESGFDGVSTGRGNARRGRKSGGDGNNVRATRGRKGRKRDDGEDTKRRDSAKSERDSAIEEINSLLDDFVKAGKEDLSLSVVGMNPKQIEIAGKILVAGVKLGYTYVKDGVYKFNDWRKAMRSKLADPFSKAMKLTDAEIDEFIQDMWNYPYSIDGQTKLLREWAAEMEKSELRSQVRMGLEEKARLQREAENIPVEVGNMQNIVETLPYLLPQQQEDVLKAETQFFDPSHADRDHAYGKGYLFTNGTGTGKTYTGLGIVKRFIKQGKGRILILTPSQQKVLDWTKDAKNLGIDLKPLESTKDKGEGAVITTFANLRTNKALMEDDFDLVVYDESHRIMENKNADETIGVRQHYMITNKNEDEAIRRLQSLHPLWIEQEELIKELDSLGKMMADPDMMQEEYAEKDSRKKQIETRLQEIRELQDKAMPEIREKAKKAVERTKTVFLSATPFNTIPSLAYTEGYIFSYPEENRNTVGSYNHRSPREQFLETQFGAGYRFRYGRIENHVENPEALSQQEVQFSDYLENTLQTKSGRIIDSEYDYSRDFPTVTFEMASMFNNALQDVFDYGSDKYSEIRDAFYNVFYNYNYSTALFETMKIAAIVPRIKQHLDMGRKVVVFHRRVSSKNELVPPFRLSLDMARSMASTLKDSNPEEKEKKRLILKQIADFENDYSKLLQYEKTLNYSMPREQLAEVFGADNVLYFSGKESKKAKDDAVRQFNDDNSGKNIIVIQEASGKEGISLHDTTGNHQRVLITLALPQSPITALQIEGRTYRIGNKSNAIFEYPLLGLNLETTLFGSKFNQQVSTTENLALGSKARNLRNAFAEGVMQHSGDIPLESQGVGGKEFDNAGKDVQDGFDKAVLDYYGTQKLKGKRNERAGIDYFPTPEPVGYKMVEWARLEDGEEVLEPSAGHGAIARYVPMSNGLTAVEPSQDLFSLLQLRAGGNGRKFMNDIFENLNTVNKYDVVVMNPPYGQAGKKAIDHLSKAFDHLNEGGRVIAIIPRGSTDNKFDKWLSETPSAAFVGEVLLPTSAFNRAGTSVSTRVVLVDKVTRKEARKDLPRHVSFDLSSYEAIDGKDGLFEALRDIDMPRRTIDKVAIDMKNARKMAKSFRDIPGVESVIVNEDGISVDGRYPKFIYLTWSDLRSPRKYGQVNDKYNSYLNDKGKKASENAEFYDTVLKTFQAVSGLTHEQFMEQANKEASVSLPRYRYIMDTNTRTGDYMHLASPETQGTLTDEQYAKVLSVAKKHGGYWNRFKKAFHFDTREQAMEFIDELSSYNTNNTRFRESYTTEEEDIIDKSQKDGTYMKAPNGNPTNLSEKQWAQVRTKSFKDWFGDWENDPNDSSRIVDENGEPKVVYHGTYSKFETFNRELLGQVTDFNASDENWAKTSHIGFWFNDKKIGFYNIHIPCFLNIRNPIEMGSMQELAEEMSYYNSGEDFRDYNSDQYDSVIIENDEEMGNTSYSVFDSNQIKSATDNIGTFSSQDEDIRYRYNDNGLQDNTRIEEAGPEANREGSRARTETVEANGNFGAQDNTPVGSTGRETAEANDGVYNGDRVNGQQTGNYDRASDQGTGRENRPANGDIDGQDGQRPVGIDTEGGEQGQRDIDSGRGNNLGNIQPGDNRGATDNGDRGTNNVDKRLDREGNGIGRTYQGRQRIIEVSNETAGSLGQRVTVITDINELPDGDAKRAISQGRKVTGWYDIPSRTVYVYAPNVADENEAKRTILHETVGHKGLRQLIGERDYDAEMARLFGLLPKKERDAVADRASRRYDGDVSVAMDEYLAEKAELDEKPYWWEKAVSSVRDMLRKIGIDVRLTDNDVKYLLWRSRQGLANANATAMAEDMVMRDKLGIDPKRGGDSRFRTAGERSVHDHSNIDQYATERQVGSAKEQYERTLKTSAYKFQEAMQDSMLGLKTLMDAVEKESGKKIMDYENAYIAENAMSSKNLSEMEVSRRTVQKNMIDEITKLEKRGTTFDEISDYLIAKHGIERNRLMALKKALSKNEETYQKNMEDYIAGRDAIRANGKTWEEQQRELDELAESYGANLAEDYSGFNEMFPPADNSTEYDREAAYGYVTDYENAYDTSGVLRSVAEMNASILDKQRNSGLMSDNAYKTISDMYQYYVPLRGWEQTTADEAYTYLTTDRGVFNAPVKTAYGRRSKAANPIFNMVNMAESGIVEGNRNLMKQRFLTMAQNHKTDLVSVSDMWVKEVEVMDEDGNMVKEWQAQFPTIPDNATPEQVESIVTKFNERMEELSKDKDSKIKRSKDMGNIPYKILPREKREHQVIVKRNGKEYVLTVNGNPRAAQALNGLTNPDNNKTGWYGTLERSGKWLNRHLAANYTTRNPGFVISNFLRDMIYSNSMVWVKENPLYALRFNRNFAKVNPAKMFSLLRKYENGTLDMSNETERYFNEFMRGGGVTGYTNIRDVEAIRSDIAKEMRYSNKRLSIGKAFNILGKWMDLLNRSVENNSRFAAYVTSRQEGRSVDRSVYDAKEISVNFNKKGSGSKFLGEKDMGVIGNMAAFTSGAGQSLYVFWNAGVQGVSNTAKIAKNNKLKFAGLGATYFLLGSLINVAMQELGGDDDDEAGDYYDLPEYVRRNNICIRNGVGGWITIPLPIELRAIYGLGELVAGLATGREKMSDQKVAMKVAEQFSQIMPLDMLGDGGGFMAFVPSSVKPLVEAGVNVDWTGLPIYKDNDFNKTLPEWTKAYSNVDPTLLALSKNLNEWTGGDKYTVGAVNINPAIVEHILSGYLGGFESMRAQLVKSIDTAIGDREFEWRNVPVLSRVIREVDERTRMKAVNDAYYDNLKEMDDIHQRLLGYRKELSDPKNTPIDIAEYTQKYRDLLQSDEYRAYYEFNMLNKNYKKLNDLYKQTNDERLVEYMDDLKVSMNEIADMIK